MTQESYRHPIAPPPELVQQWAYQRKYLSDQVVFSEIAQWGADWELEACCADIHTVHGKHRADWLRDMRRPKPPSLKEQALKELAWVGKHLDMPLHNRCNAIHTIHRALEQLDD